jgi:hypothetical protein
MTDIQWVREQLTAIARDVGEVKVDIAEIKTGCGSCGKSITSLEGAVFGNGQEGLKTRALRTESEIKAIKSERSRDWGWFVRTAVVVGWLVTTGCLFWTTFKK